MKEGELYIDMPDNNLTERQKWLKYEYIDKLKHLDNLITIRKEIDYKIEKIEKEIL